MKEAAKEGSRQLWEEMEEHLEQKEGPASGETRVRGDLAMLKGLWE